MFDLNSASLYYARVYYYVEDVDNLSISPGKLKLFEKISKRITDPMFKFMDEEDAGIAKSLLLGDKSAMTEEDEGVFSATGLSHVFAVSGMHVGFLAAIVVFALKKLKVKAPARLIITSAFILLYGFLTGFPSGIKRAFIMTFICMLAPLLHRKNDLVTSLSAACFVIILTNPRELFDLGFLMSVLAVGGIILFARPLRDLLGKVIKGKVAGKIVALISVTVSANALLLPIYTDVFGSIAVYAVLANLIILPIITFVYGFIAIAALLCVISPSFGVLYYPIQYPITLIRLISTGIASLPFAVVETGALGIVGIIYIVTLLFVSPINKLKAMPKLTFAATASVASCLILILL